MNQRMQIGNSMNGSKYQFKVIQTVLDELWIHEILMKSPNEQSHKVLENGTFRWIEVGNLDRIKSVSITIENWKSHYENYISTSV